MGSEYKTYYDAIMNRIYEHRNWPSSAVKANWTAIYKVCSLLFYLPGDEEDENLITQLIEKCVGPYHVRGGIYTNIGFVSFPEINLNEIKEKLMSRSGI